MADRSTGGPRVEGGRVGLNGKGQAEDEHYGSSSSRLSSRQTCHAYSKGYCSYGANCRYAHEGDGRKAELFEERLAKQVALRRENNHNPLWDRLSSSDESSVPSSDEAGREKEEANPATGQRKRAASVSSVSTSGSSSSDRRRKERKRKRKRKQKQKSKSKRSKRSKNKDKVKRSKKKRKKRSDSVTSNSSSSSDARVVNLGGKPKSIPRSDEDTEAVAVKKQGLTVAAMDEDGKSDDEDIGPKPLEQVQVAELKQSAYGGALLPGEGAAIAQFVQNNARIPRRGEIGWSGKDIEKFEQAGYVMSGSRHTRMNAVRLRKENQVYTAEEKRSLALRNHEEKQQREVKLMSEFR